MKALENLKNVIEVGNNFYSCGDDKVYYGDDILNLNSIQIEEGVLIRKICYSSDLSLFCAVGGIDKIYTSSDFINWTDVSIPLAYPNRMTDVIYCDFLNKLVIVNDIRLRFTSTSVTLTFTC